MVFTIVWSADLFIDSLAGEGEKRGCTRESQFSYLDREGNTILHAAVNGGCPLTLKVCLEAGAPPDIKQVCRNLPNIDSHF